jgi:pimeloyl-ACP methyl ester carboxylesterase
MTHGRQGANTAEFRHRQVEADGIPVHVVEAGLPSKPALLFLHGWPQCWRAFESVMNGMSEHAHVIAIDLPGIGESEIPPRFNDKKTLARYLHGLVETLRLSDVTLVGHDVGGQIVYAYLHEYDRLEKAVIMNVAVPGVDPWSEVKRNPHIWHFAFHLVPNLPEMLVRGKEAAYFDFFFDTISAKPDGVSQSARRMYVEAYSRPAALHTGFEWYRAFPQDEKDNLASKEASVQTRVLYLRGERETGTLEEYVNGLRQSGLSNVEGRLIPNSGHYAADEQPGEVVAILRDFITA